MKTLAERVSSVGPGPGLRTLAERLTDVGYWSAGFIANAVVGRSSGLHRGYQDYVLRFPRTRDDAENDKQRIQDVRIFLDKVGQNPFLLYLHTMEPHNPTGTPDRFIRRIGDFSWDALRDHRVSVLKYNSYRHRDWKAGDPVGTTDSTDDQDDLLEYFSSRREPYEVIYDASILRADANVGEIIGELKKRGLWDKALFIFLSDHGEEFGEHGGWFHGQSVYEELSHVPLLMHFPGGEFAGLRIATPVSLVDIMPTIFDYMDRPELCSGCRGSSLLPLLRGEIDAEDGSDSILAMRLNRINYYRPWKQSRGDVNVVIRQAQWKGIWNDEVGSLELYDLERDPGEQSDVSAEHPELVEALGAQARAWLQDCRTQAKQPQELGEIDEETQEQLRALGYFN